MGFESGSRGTVSGGAVGATSSGGEVGGVATPSGGLAGEPPASPRLFVVLPKVVSQDALRQIFSKFPGMERCDLKLDRASGRSKGFAYVTFTSELQAEAAIRELDGLLITAQHRMRVMFAEAGGNPPAPGAPPGAPPSAPQAAPPGGPCECSGDPPPLPGALPPEGGGERAAGDAVEAVRDCFANMTMPFSSPGQAAGHAGPKGPPSKTVERGRLAAGAGAAGAAGIEGLGSGRLRPSPTSSLSGDGGGAGSTLSTASRMRPADRPSFSGSGEGGDDAASSGAAGAAPDRSRLFSKLSRPLPDYTIFHIFSKYGNVESVRLQRDKRHAFVKFSLPDEAQAAIAGLNGSEILGEKLKVAVADLRRDSRKRPRLGPAPTGAAAGAG